MKQPAKLSDLIEALESESEEYCSFFDRDTGQGVVVARTILSAVEEGEENTLTNLPDWQKEDIANARAIVNDSGGRFIAPPNKFDFDEYHQMERFILSLSDEEAAGQLWNAIKGSKSFRRFKDTLYRLGIENQWFRYRDEAMKECAIEWAEAHDVPYEDDINEEKR